MTAKHTPGPWGIDDRAIYASGAGNLAMVMQSVLQGDARANARLISAAPDLLAALEELRILAHNSFGRDHPAVMNARAAIAKATGQ